MILTCTSCSTRYYVDDGAVGPAGRTVRCASCGHEWFADGQLTLGEGATVDRQEPLTRERVERMRRAAEQPGPAPSAAARFRQQQQDRMRKERQRAAVVTWSATGVALAASVTGAVAFRQDVAEIWPRSASAYAAVGLDVNVYGLEFEQLAVERTMDGATPVLMVTGQIHNIGRDDNAAPPVRITLRDSHARSLFELVSVVGNAPIRAGTTTPFQIRVQNPPNDAVDLEASFASMAEAPTTQLTTRSPAPLAPLVLDAEHEVSEDMVEPAAIPPAARPTASNAPADGLAPRFTSEPTGERG